ncbi:O-antigen ligase family protein [bacterium]|nr:O-antigen ligase family protein [bacterium]
MNENIKLKLFLEKLTKYYLFFVIFSQLLLESPSYIKYSNILTSGMIIIFALNIIILKKEPFIDKNNLLYLLLSSYFILSIFWHVDYSKIELNDVMPYILIPPMLIIIYNLTIWHDTLNNLIWAFISILFVNFLVYLTNYTPFFTEEIYLGGRFIGTFLNPNTASISFLFSMFYSIVYFKKYQNIKSLIVLFIIMIIGTVLVLATASRKGFLLIPFIWVIYFIENITFNKKIFISITVIASLFVFLNFTGVFDLLKIEKVFTNAEKRFNDFSENISGNRRGKLDKSSNERLSFINSGLEKIQDRPILGYGISAFKIFHAGYYSHNNYIELLFNGGIIALFIFYFRYIRILRKISKIKFKIGYKYIFFILMIMITEMAVVTIVYKPFLYMLIVIEIIMYKESDKPKNVKDKNFILGRHYD